MQGAFYLSSDEKHKTKRKRKDLCSLQCDVVDFCGLTVYFKGH